MRRPHRHRSSGGRRAPDWASFFEGGGYWDFIQELEAEMSLRKFTYDIDALGGVLYYYHEQRGRHSLGLLNLAQACNLIPRQEWRSTIAQHLDVAPKSFEEDIDIVTSLFGKFEDARSRLKVRLHPDGPPYTVTSACKRVAEGLLAVAVLDSWPTIINVPSPLADSWGMSVDELLEIGIRNVRESLRPVPERMPLPYRGSIMLVDAASFFTSTLALCLSDFRDADGPYGSLVGIPLRSSLFYYPIKDKEVMTAIAQFLPIIQHFHHEGPGSISPHLYWHAGGRIHHLPAVIKGGVLHFMPGDEFEEQVTEPLGLTPGLQ